TQLAQVGERVVAVGLDGVQLQSRDGGASFGATQREDGLSLTALSADDAGRIRLYSKRGVVAGPAGAGATAKP
ncbi:MAG TPA: glycosyl hydrolase, partial [Rubrivivax sp.]|nr:glycosyl hydrolase [Rubrivivax sp.]